MVRLLWRKDRKWVRNKRKKLVMLIDKLNNFYNNYPDEKLKIICLDDIEKLEELEQSNNYSINNIICLGKHINEFNKNIIISGDL